MPTPPILIVGAGPTGLTLALRLARHGVPFRIVERNDGPGQASRAMVLQARTLEFYGQLGLAADVIARGIRVRRAHLREHGDEVATISFEDIGEGLSPYPTPLCFAQDDHERFLVDRLATEGVAVEWGTTLARFEQDEAGVRAVLVRDGAETTCAASYLCGCDGAHTAVRRELGIGFPGGTYDQLFYVADVEVQGAETGDLTMHLGERSLVLMLPVRSSGTQRLIGVVPPALGDRRELTFADVRPSAEALLGIEVAAVNWFSTYRVHHRVADRFRAGRAFLVGDAGHLHSPAGGQGMNTGIGDAVNLSWKLAHVVGGRADPAILDSYESERIAFAKKLVETTDRAFQGMVGEGWGSRFLRTWMIPHLAPALTGIPAVRRALFSTVSQTRIAYRDSALSAGRAGAVHGGDRLPWLDGNYDRLQGRDWLVQVYGALRPTFGAAVTRLGLPTEIRSWNEAADAAGFARDAAYLIRPDGHVGLASPDQDADAMRRYAVRIGLPDAASQAAD